MQMLKFREQKEIDLVLNLFKANSKQRTFECDQRTLAKYDQNNKHFSLIKRLSTNAGGGQRLVVGFHWIYQYENHQIQLEYLILEAIWKIISQKSNFEEQEQLNILLEDVNNATTLSFDQQIQFLINKFDQFYSQLNPKENSQEEDNEIEDINQLSLNNQTFPPTTIIELDEEQTDFPLPSPSINTHQNLNNLTPSITSDRIRQDSSCSSTNSLKYTQFIPPSAVSIRRRRRVIQSMHLHVQRKKTSFGKLIADQLKHTPIEPIMYQLGLEFLRIYDGKFNYPQGFTFVMSFEKRIWFLTIGSIKCVDCQLGECEPRSILILQYKNKFTTVQV